MNGEPERVDKTAVIAKYVLIFLSIFLVIVTVGIIFASFYASANNYDFRFDSNIIAFFVGLSFVSILQVAGIKIPKIKKPKIEFDFGEEEEEKLSKKNKKH